jgi:hypothetical protein
MDFSKTSTFETNKDSFNPNKRELLLSPKILSDIKRVRSRSKMRYFENKTIEYRFNIIEDGDDVVFGFSGTESLIGWLQDFNAFFVKLDNSEDILKKSSNFSVLNGRKLPEELRLFKDVKLNNTYKNFTVKDKSKIPDNMISLIEKFEEEKDKYYFHQGFIIQYNAIAAKIDELLRFYLNKHKNILFIGHSLGSVMAKLSCLTSILKYPHEYEKFYYYGFGTPRLCTKKAEEFIDIELNRLKDTFHYIKLKGDIVTFVPPIDLGYSPPLKNEYQIDKKKDTEDDPTRHSYIYYISNLHV